MVFPASRPSRATFRRKFRGPLAIISEKTVRRLIGLVFLCLASPQAMAAAEDYCAAYARDFADAGRREEVIWKHRFEIAKDACLLQFTPAAAAAATTTTAAAEPPPPQPKPKPKPKPKLPAPSDDSAQEASIYGDAPEPATKKQAARKTRGKLAPGSQAWLDYCDRKYASFNRETGTYTSFSGEERKCLVNRSDR